MEKERRSGNTTRVVDRLVQEYFAHGVCHVYENRDGFSANQHVMDRFNLRMSTEHPNEYFEMARTIENGICYFKVVKISRPMGKVIKEVMDRRRLIEKEKGREHLKWVQDIIDYGKENIEDFRENDISDGYHTFEELYEFRKVYHALLFNEWGRVNGFSSGIETPRYDVHKSWKHHDGEDCFVGGKHKWFIVVAMLPTGQVTNHYKAKDWDLFKVPEAPKAKYEFDGHTPQDVLERLKKIL